VTHDLVTSLVLVVTVAAILALVLDVALALRRLRRGRAAGRRDDGDFPDSLRIAASLLALMSVVWLGNNVVSSSGCRLKEAGAVHHFVDGSGGPLLKVHGPAGAAHRSIR
jgi:hypothetical protein